MEDALSKSPGQIMKLFYEATKLPIARFEDGQITDQFTHDMPDFGLPAALSHRLPQSLPSMWVANTAEFVYFAGLQMQDASGTESFLLIGPTLLYECSVTQAQDILRSIAHPAAEFEQVRRYFHETGTRSLQSLLSALQLLAILLRRPPEDSARMISCVDAQVQVYEDPLLYIKDEADTRQTENVFTSYIEGGDVEALKRFLGTYLYNPAKLEALDLETQRLYILSAASFGSRLAINAGVDYSLVSSISISYMRRIQKASHKSDLTQLFLQCMQEYTLMISGHKSVPEGHPLTGYIRQYVITHYSEKITSARIAQELGMNVSSLCTQFKKESGMTVSTYVQTEKIRKAQQYLKGGSSISDISNALGFSSESYFCATFKKITGQTPAEYRRSQERKAPVHS